MENGKRSLVACLLLLSLLSGGAALGDVGDEFDLAGRWRLLAKGPEHATAVWIFEKKEGQWTGTWLIRGEEVPLVEFEFFPENRVKFRITARQNSWFYGQLTPSGELEGLVETPAGSRRVVANRMRTLSVPDTPAPTGADATGSTTLD